MAKVLLVEDDVNLREIYAARLQAEGFETSTADDGEKALAVAVKERPDLIILDVMMPKISGFDVLDILRSTPETKNAKIMMMTALSQDSDKERGEKLGANRYLVKSQVTLEDMLLNAKQLLEEVSVPASDEQTVPAQANASAEVDSAVNSLAAKAPAVPAEPVAPVLEPTSGPIVDSQVAEPLVAEPPVPAAVDEPVVQPPTEPVPPQPEPVDEPTIQTQPASENDVQDTSSQQPTTITEPIEPEPVQHTVPQPPSDNDFSTVQTPGTVIQPTTPADDSES